MELQGGLVHQIRKGPHQLSPAEGEPSCWWSAALRDFRRLLQRQVQQVQAHPTRSQLG